MITTVISFSSSDAKFFEACLDGVRPFSQQIIGVTCDHFFDQVEEDLGSLRGVYAAHPEVQFVQYPFSKESFYGNHSPKFWHNVSRMVGAHFAKGDYILFLDVDEVVEGAEFAKWLERFPLSEYEALHLACYWYFREAKYRAKMIEDTPLLIRRSSIDYEGLMQPQERLGMFYGTRGRRERCIEGKNPLIHHYSWVRTKEEMLRKVMSWGHSRERNWEALVEEEFSRPFNGTDFVHGYEFEEVKPTLSLRGYERREKISENVQILTIRDVHKIDLQLKFGETQIGGSI